MVWGKAGSTTLTATATTVNSGTFTASKFNQVMVDKLATANNAMAFQFNSDTGTNYSSRYSDNGGADNTSKTNQTSAVVAIGFSNGHEFSVTYICNIASKEKIMMAWILSNTGNTAASAAPERREFVNKWVNTSDSITDVTLIDQNGYSFIADTNLTVLGSDLTPAAAVPATILDGLIFEETDTNKHYIYTTSTDTWTEI